MFEALALLVAQSLVSSPNPTATPQETARPLTRFYWGHLDADGLPDALAVSSEGNTLLRNLGNGSFEDVTALSELQELRPVRWALWGDVDADGFDDLVTTSGHGEVRLWRNSGNLGLAELGSHQLEPPAAVTSGHWMDLDHDHRPDLHLAASTGDVLLRNEGEGRFAAVEVQVRRAAEAGGGVPSRVGASTRIAAGLEGVRDTVGGREGDASPATPEDGDPSSIAPDRNPVATGKTNALATAGIGCATTLQDQSTGQCLAASSVPTLGRLYPLSEDLFVDAATGRVGLGTTAPAQELDVVGNSRFTGDLQVVGRTAVGDLPGYPNHMLSSRVDASNGNHTEAFFAENLRTSGGASGIIGKTLDPTGFGVKSEGNMRVEGNVEMGSVLTMDAGGGNTYEISGSSVSLDITKGGTSNGLSVGNGLISVSGASSASALLVRTAPVSVWNVGVHAGSDRFQIGPGTSDAALRIESDGDAELTGDLQVTGGAEFATGVQVTGGSEFTDHVRFTGRVDVGDLPGYPNHMLSARVDATSTGTNVAFFGENLRTSGGAIGVLGKSLDPTGYGLQSEGNMRVSGGDLTVHGGAHFDNQISVPTIEIRGGADLVEGFETSDEGPVEPGTVLVIDPENPGALRTSSEPYDFKVAGVLSGAGGVDPGILLGRGSVLDGDAKVAMTGRVYVKCSTENGAIVPGDRLTTASLAGHAMKATDSERSDGAVIGKAMSSLESETGLVLVLVNLQ